MVVGGPGVVLFLVGVFGPGLSTAGPPKVEVGIRSISLWRAVLEFGGMTYDTSGSLGGGAIRESRIQGLMPCMAGGVGVVVGAYGFAICLELGCHVDGTGLGWV